jgi:hypothetical protein
MGRGYGTFSAELNIRYSSYRCLPADVCPSCLAQSYDYRVLVFRLKPNFGGVEKVVHQHIIKKIYGREAGLEVLHRLYICFESIDVLLNNVIY